MSRSVVISLIGRPNVGKSSLFNKILRKASKAVTYNTPGVTRDRHYSVASLDEDAHLPPATAVMVDTGGFYPTELKGDQGKDPHFFNIMREHAYQAIHESDLILLIVDVREGLLPFDETILKEVRKSKKPYWVLANKFDSDSQWGQETDFYRLGVKEEDLFMVSAAHGYGVTELKERLHQFSHHHGSLKKEGEWIQKGVTPRENVVARMSLLGAPNAGKSTLLNHLVGSERALVSPIAGTTVDPIEGYFDIYFGKEALEFTEERKSSDKKLLADYERLRQNNFFAQEQLIEFADDMDLLSAEELEALALNGEADDEKGFLPGLEKEEAFERVPPKGDKEQGSFWRTVQIIDTAGIRRKAAVHGEIESQGVYRALRAVTESDLVVFMIDSTLGPSHQDKRLLELAVEKGKSIILCLNKYDLVKDRFSNDKERKQWIEGMYDDMPWLAYIEIIPISAKEGNGLFKLKKAIKRALLVRRSVVPTGALNRTLLAAIDKHTVAIKGGNSGRFKVKYASQVKSAPPTFMLFCNRSKGIPNNYQNYLKNNLRAEFGMTGAPIHLIFRSSSDLANKVKRFDKLEKKFTS